MPKKGRKVSIPTEVLGGELDETPEDNPRAALIAADLTTDAGRSFARKEAQKLMLQGLIGPTEAAVIHQIIQGQQKDGDGGASRRTVAVRFATIETRAQADAYREAQLIKEGLADLEGVPT